ncbi:MAG: tRNA (N6-isopentenyl adenosine(37)-C2)-methylthiotransferase MiaB [Leptospiraceae bacterium]|nr:tRNA (N6-isopentenyl adenosine(37)-C2)-methylthiotransferase MiaB [Leptospiraceae bacterium]MDW8305562.1 tRNA (N6-isopentenyl adenosine(37)-C2)-methylthiotransferase MiaB [Leptospiraceae bacterium]
MIEKKKRTFYLESYGCQMNVYDSQIAATLLENQNFQEVSIPEEADFILLNTCAIRENAHEKIYHRLNELSQNKKKEQKIAILGCMAQNLKEELWQRTPVDYLFGPDALRHLSHLEVQGPKTAYLELSRTETYDEIYPHKKTTGVHAYVTIQRGCNNFCSFCVVPYTRGRERSRPVSSIVREIQLLVAQGVSMVTLLGQNVNSYRYEGYDFADLVETILEKTEIKRIYFTSPHPKDFPEKLLYLMAREERFGNYIHLPLQSGSDKILKKMKRNYTQKRFLELVAKIREIVPGVVLSTDVIVGFSGESEEDFAQTLHAMEKADFDFAYMFAYSERKGTIAGRLYPDDISSEEKKRRLNILIEEQNKRSWRKNQEYVGSQVDVIVEKKARRGENHLLGRMRNFKKVVFPASDDIQFGQRLQVKIHRATSMTLLGELV